MWAARSSKSFDGSYFSKSSISPRHSRSSTSHSYVRSIVSSKFISSSVPVIDIAVFYPLIVTSLGFKLLVYIYRILLSLEDPCPYDWGNFIIETEVCLPLFYLSCLKYKSPTVSNTLFYLVCGLILSWEMVGARANCTIGWLWCSSKKLS